jgi:hypothetical protein
LAGFRFMTDDLSRHVGAISATTPEGADAAKAALAEKLFELEATQATDRGVASRA